MQATARLLEDASHKFQLTGEERWFIEFCELVSDIKGLNPQVISDTAHKLLSQPPNSNIIFFNIETIIFRYFDIIPMSQFIYWR
ncbi:unnamed protein product [Blepharisma stoltei]|uniref:Uncharacterized protein n=1 Tax=Blepharisma stoltei TaxID=1481888 RepID=A0AAU9KAB2_9CILI|nr:unnamed protein product [Blepharisma stoltei]